MLAKMAEVLLKIAVMMMAPAALRRHRKQGGEGPPFFFFFLDLLPRWEKGFPSGPWPPWHGRGQSPSKIGSVSLSLPGSAFCSAALSPFHIYMEIRNSDWTETFAVIFFTKNYLSCGRRRASTSLRGAHKGQGCAQGGRRAPCLVATSGTVSHGFFFWNSPNIPKIFSVRFYPVLDSV